MQPIINYEAKAETSFSVKEQARKTALLRLFCLVGLGFQALSIFFDGLSYLFMGMGLLSLEILLVPLVICFVASYKLAGRQQYRLACWLLVGPFLLESAGWYLQFGTARPVMLVFILMIIIAALLMTTREVTAVAAFSGGFTVGMYLFQDILQLYQPTAFPNPQVHHLLWGLFFGVVIVPALVALLVGAGQAQLRLIQTQNRELEVALHEVKARHEAGQQVNQQVLEQTVILNGAATQQASTSQEQAAITNQVHALVTELSEAATNIAGLSAEVNFAASRVAEASYQIENTTMQVADWAGRGLSSIGYTRSAIREMSEFYLFLLEIMANLEEKSANIRKMLNLLKTITAESHLLALNAAIEAAGAGEYGQRFAVIAQEFKRLSSHSAASAEEVGQTVTGIEGAIQEAAQVAESGLQKMRSMAGAAEETGEIIKELRRASDSSVKEANTISQLSSQFKELATIIRAATGQQQLAGEQVRQALGELHLMAQEASKGSKLVSGSVEQLEKTSQQLALI